MQYIIRSSFQDFIGSPVPLTPHSATLHVGLKFLALSGLMRPQRLKKGTIVLRGLGT
ncbi:hypothetical protein Barb4_05054 [Bacteroidales bacterium Barb4]|nr:hypothetical protein Barb4_05054 [Bacteroidales bacterium Barb4]